MILLQAGGGDGGLFQIGLLVLMFGVFYFFFIRPQQKKQKDQKKLIDDLKKGDKVVLSSGLHGTVFQIEDELLTLEVDNRGTKLKYNKSSVSLEGTKAIQGK